MTKNTSACVRPLLLCSSEIGKLTAADKLRLCGVEQRIAIRIYVIQLVDRVSNDAPRERVRVVAKMKDILLCVGIVMSLS